MDIKTLTTPQASALVGGAGTGKTQRLVDNVAELILKGVACEDIIVFCASPVAQNAFERRLSEKVDALPEVTTMRDFALDILSLPEIQKKTGRKPELLSQFEINFLLEDMKTTGLRPKRLKEMLKFFYRGWTELEDDKEDFLIVNEEIQVHSLLKENLAFMEAYLEPEISNTAYKMLRDDATLANQYSYDHVLIDDYQLQSKATQLMANAIARESILVTGNTYEITEVYESYPYAEGLDEFSEINPQAETENLNYSYASSHIVKAVNSLLEDDYKRLQVEGEQDDSELRILEATTPDKEFEAVARTVESLIEDSVSPDDILVVAPHRVWQRNVVKALRDKGLKVDDIAGKQVLSGDIREIRKSESLRLYTALKLVADPHNATAWRCWCGFGDYLTHSSVFTSLRQYAADNELTLVNALEIASKNMASGINGIEKLVPCYESGKILTERAQGKMGTALIEHLAESIDVSKKAVAALLSLCDPIDEKDDALTLYTRAVAKLLSPRFSGNKDAVKVCSPKHASGLDPAYLIFCGFTNGFIPHGDYFDGTKTPLDKQEKMYAKDKRLLYSTLGKPHVGLILSYSTKSDLESASMLNLKIERIRLEKGERVCRLSPSIFLDEIK